MKLSYSHHHPFRQVFHKLQSKDMPVDFNWNHWLLFHSLTLSLSFLFLVLYFIWSSFFTYTIYHMHYTDKLYGVNERFILCIRLKESACVSKLNLLLINASRSYVNQHFILLMLLPLLLLHHPHQLPVELMLHAM